MHDLTPLTVKIMISLCGGLVDLTKEVVLYLTYYILSQYGL